MEKYIFNTDPEEKCGFLISKKRKLLWKVELEELEKFDQICTKYNLRYFLIGGAAIGVERHKGFIPWDDDLDIGMLRKDFEKFLEVCRVEMQEPFHLQYGVEDSDDWSLFCRIRHSNTTAMIKWQKEQNCNHGVYIELYPFDRVPNSTMKQYIQIELSSFFRQLIEDRFEKRKSRIFRILAFPFKGISAEKLFEMWDSVCTYYNDKKGDMVNTVSMPNYAKQKSCYYKYDDVSQTIKKPFENMSVQMAINNDKILRICYGDYMEMPPIEKRGEAHNKIVYFDPQTPYKEVEKTDLPERFFAGEWDLGRL